MADPRHQEWILDTIDQLRGRKARPDLERICHMLERKYGLSSRLTESCLERLVDSEVVMKVEYKGSTSYRHAAKWRKSHLKGAVMNSSSASRNLVEAVFECENMNKEELGASLPDIEQWFLTHDNEKLKCPINVALQREIDVGRLEKLANGNYTIHYDRPKSPKLKKAIGPSRRGRPPKIKTGTIGRPSSVSTPASSSNKPDKTEKKLKRAHSSDVTEGAGVPVKSKQRLIEAKCDFCGQTEDGNKHGVPEILLICKDCNAKAHPTCMDYTEELSRRACQSHWQCIDCKTCCMCDDSGEPDLMLFCDGCDKGYHMNCHHPPVSEKPQGKWVCTECLIEGVSVEVLELQDRIRYTSILNNNVNDSAFPLTPCDSPQTDDRPRYHSLSPPVLKPKVLSREPRLEGLFYPDASQWSIEEVVIFISSVGFTDQSEAFREQEIDGKSLLLMKRSDVLTGLSLRLGPALKIYRHVQRLQTASEDIR